MDSLLERYAWRHRQRKFMALVEKMWFKSTKWGPVCSAQEQVIRTNCVKYYIDKSVDSPFCRMCGETGKTISHIVSECSKLAQREYKRRHDVARVVH